MIQQFTLLDYNASINQEIKDTDTFINQVKEIIENNFPHSTSDFNSEE